MAISLSDSKNNTSFLTPEQKKQRKMIAILGGVVLVIALVLYFGFFKGKTSVVIPENNLPLNGPLTENLTQSNDSLMEKISNLKTSDMVYQDKRFSGLVLHGELPVVVGEKGRENPFMPF